MSEVTRRIAPDSARQTAAELRELGITIPKDVRALLDSLDRLDAERPREVTQADLENAYIEGQSEDQIRTLAADLGSHAARLNAWSEARIKVGQRALREFTANGDDLTAALAKLAAPLIEKLVDAAGLDTLNTTALIRAGRSADAEAAARVEIVAGDLDKLYRLRDRVTKGAEYGVDGIDCRRWQDPRKVAGRPVNGALDSFLSGIKADAGLWFPLPAQAQQQAAPLAQEAAVAAQAERARHHVGSVAFAG